MGREIVVAWVGRPRRDAWETLCRDYRERVGHWVPVRDLPVKAPLAGDDASRRGAEAEAIRSALPTPCRIVALDRRAKALSSADLADRLARDLEEWPHPIAFVVGSDLGLDPGFVAQADRRWSLGPLTLPHAMARLLVYEQLYRALSIRAGIKYHRQPF